MQLTLEMNFHMNYPQKKLRIYRNLRNCPIDKIVKMNKHDKISEIYSNNFYNILLVWFYKNMLLDRYY